MTLIRAVLEGSFILAIAAGALLISARPVIDGWANLLTVLARAGGLALSCLLAFYYAGLYDSRVTRNFEAFLGRIPRAIGTAIALLTLASLLIPAARVLDDLFA